jgi:hypothetical protein
MSVERPGEGMIQEEPLRLQPSRTAHEAGPQGGEAALLRQPAIVTKLQVLLRAHQAACAGPWLLPWLIRGGLFLLAVGVSVAFGVLLGLALYDERGADHYTQQYSEDGDEIRPDAWPRRRAVEWYIKGQSVSRQEYDYFRKTHSSQKAAASAAFTGLGAGFALLVVLCVLIWWLTRHRDRGMSAAVQEQINSIVKEHPAAVQEWGGPAVLRQPELVAEVLRIEQRNAWAGEREPERPRAD